MSQSTLTDEQQENAQDEVRHIYAGVMAKLSHLGLGAMVVFFILYLTGLIPGKKTPEELVPLLVEPSAVLIEKTGLKTGWGWLSDLAYGDTLSFSAIALIAAISIFIFAILPFSFFKKGLRIYGWMALVQFLIFLLAASGLVSGSH